MVDRLQRRRRRCPKPVSLSAGHISGARKRERGREGGGENEEELDLAGLLSVVEWFLAQAKPRHHVFVFCTCSGAAACMHAVCPRSDDSGSLESRWTCSETNAMSKGTVSAAAVLNGCSGVF